MTDLLMSINSNHIPIPVPRPEHIEPVNTIIQHTTGVPMDYLIIALSCLAAGAIIGWVVKSYGVAGTISAIQTDVSTVKSDVTTLQNKFTGTAVAPKAPVA